MNVFLWIFNIPFTWLLGPLVRLQNTYSYIKFSWFYLYVLYNYIHYLFFMFSLRNRFVSIVRNVPCFKMQLSENQLVLYKERERLTQLTKELETLKFDHIQKCSGKFISIFIYYLFVLSIKISGKPEPIEFSIWGKLELVPWEWG